MTKQRDKNKVRTDDYESGITFNIFFNQLA